MNARLADPSATDSPTIDRPDAVAPVAAARAVDAYKIYGRGQTEVRALDGVTIEFAAHSFTAIMGPSGSGKSRLLHCVAGLDTLTSGQVFVGADELGALSDKELTLLRRDRIGFVFQAYNLIPTLTAAENITLPLRLAGRKPDGSSLVAAIEATKIITPAASVIQRWRTEVRTSRV